METPRQTLAQKQMTPRKTDTVGKFWNRLDPAYRVVVFDTPKWWPISAILLKYEQLGYDAQDLIAAQFAELPRR